MANNSDYSKKFTSIYELLPEVLQSDVNLSAFANGFDRFLTKAETIKVAGYIGQPNLQAKYSRRIVENTPSRQANQLQPILYVKIGKVEYMMSWADIMSELRRLGVDMNTFNEWGSVKEFSWAPPVNLDKIANYTNYYWEDNANPGSTPDYVVIENNTSDPGHTSLTAYNTSARQWMEANKWVHRDDITNFSIVKQAQLPIIEYNENLEINEYTYTSFNWKYRKSSASAFTSTTNGPTKFELHTVNPNVSSIAPNLTLTATCGDLTDIFVPGFKFKKQGGSIVYTVVDSRFLATTPGNQNNQTRIVTDIAISDIVAGDIIVPLTTSHGDSFVSLGTHWLFDGANDPVPVKHPPLNQFTTYSQPFATAGIGPYILISPNNTYALAGYDDVRVYFDNGSTRTRAYNVYNELTALDLGSGTDDELVAAIEFHNITDIPGGTTSIIIEFAPKTYSDLGMGVVPIRVDEPDAAFTINGYKNISLIQYRTYDQKKLGLNQYPLFDVYNVFGETDYRASPIIQYEESPDVRVVPGIGKRIVGYSSNDVGFDIDILDEDDDVLRAYRDYNYKADPAVIFWVDLKANKIYWWDGMTWTTKFYLSSDTNREFLRTTISNVAPNTFTYDGDLWYDTVHEVLKILVGGTWVPAAVGSTLVEDNDIMLQTIWKAGLNDDMYVPRYIDENGRVDGDVYNDPTTGLPVTVVLPIGDANGDWEIPKPLYNNHMHENLKFVSFIQMSNHLKSIIEHQPRLPLYTGPIENMYHLLKSNEVNFALGGTIKEYSPNYDVLLSAIFTNTVSPIGLFDFAGEQYANSLNAITVNFAENAVSLFTSVDSDTYDMTSFIVNEIDLLQNTNTFGELVYGDSTTFNSETNQGVQNWIATTPYFNIFCKQYPLLLTDNKLNVTDFRHHDSHLFVNELPITIIESISQQILNTPDARVSGETFGKKASNNVPNNLTEFNTLVSPVIRNNVYYYKQSSIKNVLYRLRISWAGTTPPTFTVNDGALWFDTTSGSETLYQLVAGIWTIVPGLIVGDQRLHNGINPLDEATATISAWEVVDMQTIVNNILLDVELKLYENAPTCDPIYDFSTIESNPRYNALLEELFLQNMQRDGIVNPYAASTYVSTNAFTWNYVYSSSDLYPTPLANLGGSVTVGDYRALYNFFYNTPYPHLEPWKLQGYFSKPTWWDTEYKDITNTRRWNGVMWSNILTGVIPAGRDYPNGLISITGNPLTEPVDIGPVPTLPKYEYVSVNISGTPLLWDRLYTPDDLLPPYFGNLSLPNVRSLFSNLSQIIAPGADYTFGQQGNNEWDWRASIDYVYARLKIAFILEPVKFLGTAYGYDTVTVGHLDIDSRTQKTIAHQRTLFHGAISNNETYKVNGFNQWYVNFNRFFGNDTNLSNFGLMWVNWTAPMMYQFNGMIDTASLDVSHRSIDINKYDYRTAIKKSPGVEDYWLDALKVSILSVPPIMGVDNIESNWKFALSTFSPIGKTIEYYDVRNYQFRADPTTDICSLYTYDITNVNLINNTINIKTNQTNILTSGMALTISDSASNDGLYHVSSFTYDPLSNETIITFAEVLPSNTAPFGLAKLSYRSLPWNTGDRIWISSDGVLCTYERTTATLPVEIVNSEFRTDVEYFIIKLSPTTFKISLTFNGAITGLAVNITSAGVDNQFVGQVDNMFQAVNGRRTNLVWRNYTIDTGLVHTLVPPQNVFGMQHLVDIIRGYEIKLRETGFVINQDGMQRDSELDVLLTWQSETERLIDWAYGLRLQINQINDKYEAIVDDISNEWQFVDAIGPFVTGDKVLFTCVGTPPTPLVKNGSYHIIRDTTNTFRLALTTLDAQNNNALDILAPAPSGTVMYFAKPRDLSKNAPWFEVNPFKNALWYKPEFGIISNVITGPFPDIHLDQLLFDQYGRPLPADKLHIYRQDKVTKIYADDGIDNDIRPQTIFPDPYNYLHMSGAHLFIDTYEHVLIFNNETTAGCSLYTPFLGVNTTKFNLIFYRTIEITGRPNSGGHYLLDNTLYRNIEASIDDMRMYYDVHRVVEELDTTVHARALLDYKGPIDYLRQMSLNSKSQFLFWKGALQYKGSVNAIKAFVRSRRFIDAKMDEFWAYQIGEFGNVDSPIYPQFKITSFDTVTGNLLLEFVADTGTSVDTGFIQVATSNDDVWLNKPDVVASLSSIGGVMSFDMRVIGKYPELGSPISLPTSIAQESISHNLAADLVQITVKLSYNDASYTSITGTTLSFGSRYYIPFADNIDIYKNGVLLVSGTDYTETALTNMVSNSVTLTVPAIVSDVFDLVYKTAVMREGIHFNSVNSSVVKFVAPSSQTIGGSPGAFTFWGFASDPQINNTAKIIDNASHVALKEIQIWDPARGVHYSQAYHVVDIESDNDPARYTNSTRTQTYDGKNPLPWNANEVGRIWLDTNELGYKPYYDTKIYPNIQDRILKWGELADWASIKLYEWVESDVHPDKWDGLALTQQNDTTIDDNVKKTGTTRKTLYKRKYPTIAPLPVSNDTSFIPYVRKTMEFNTATAGSTPGGLVYHVGGNTYEYRADFEKFEGIQVISVFRSGTTDTITVNANLEYVLFTGMNFKRERSADVYYGVPGVISTGTGVTSLTYDSSTGYTTITADNNTVAPFEVGETISFYPLVEVYVNNILLKDSPDMTPRVDGSYATKQAILSSTHTSQGIITLDNIASIDNILFVVPVPTDEDFITIKISEGVLKRETEHSQIITMVNDLPVIKYYFWVENKTTLSSYGSAGLKTNKTLPIQMAAKQLKEIPTTFMFPQKPVVGDRHIPNRYFQLVVRGLRGIITSDDRFTLKMIRDNSLRSIYTPEKKLIHTEWIMFREKQLFNIDPYLWNKATEAVAGMTLDLTTSVPSLERELYDETYNTTTRFGLGVGQTFVDRQQAIDAIISDLLDPTNDFYPININTFIASTSFDTPADSINTMTQIYNTFPTEHVNRIFFKLLYTAFANKSDYAGIFKTSMVALHGVRVFATPEVFDD